MILLGVLVKHTPVEAATQKGGCYHKGVMDHQTVVYPHHKKIASGISRGDWLSLAI